MDGFSVSILIAAFSMWLGLNHPEFKGVTPPPVEVKFHSYTELCYLYFGENCNPGIGPVAEALYLNDTIYLPDVCNYNKDIYCQSLILHELVHHFQIYSEIDYAAKCPTNSKAPRELEAYMIQKKWLEEQGVNPWLYIDGMAVSSAGSCK